jgi:hypothetical protein
MNGKFFVGNDDVGVTLCVCACGYIFVWVLVHFFEENMLQFMFG